MNDIFISYDRLDRERAQRFADAFESLGWSVWWDREIPLGKSFDQVIEEELNAARCVVVLWSKDSVQSRWVKSEASAAADRGCLFPVFIDRVASPLEFRLIQAAELWDWDGATRNPEFERLLLAIKEMLGEAKPAAKVITKSTPAQPKATLWATWATPRSLRAVAAIAIIIAVLTIARNAFQNAQEASPDSTIDASLTTIPSSSPLTSATADGKAIPSVAGKIHPPEPMPLRLVQGRDCRRGP